MLVVLGTIISTCIVLGFFRESINAFFDDAIRLGALMEEVKVLMDQDRIARAKQAKEEAYEEAYKEAYKEGYHTALEHLWAAEGADDDDDVDEKVDFFSSTNDNYNTEEYPW